MSDPLSLPVVELGLLALSDELGDPLAAGDQLVAIGLVAVCVIVAAVVALIAHAVGADTQVVRHLAQLGFGFGDLFGEAVDSGAHAVAAGALPIGLPRGVQHCFAQAAAMGIPEDVARQLWQPSPFSGADPASLPDQHFFDSRHMLGLDTKPSGYKFAVSSEALAAQLAGADVPIDGWEKFFGDLYPRLRAWAERWTELTGRVHSFVGGTGGSPSGWQLTRPDAQ